MEALTVISDDHTLDDITGITVDITPEDTSRKCTNPFPVPSLGNADDLAPDTTNKTNVDHLSNANTRLIRDIVPQTHISTTIIDVVPRETEDIIQIDYDSDPEDSLPLNHLGTFISTENPILTQENFSTDT